LLGIGSSTRSSPEPDSECGVVCASANEGFSANGGKVRSAPAFVPVLLGPPNRRSMVRSFSVSVVLHAFLIYAGGSYLRFAGEIERVEQRQWRTRVVELALPYDLVRHEHVEYPRPRFVARPNAEAPRRVAPVPGMLREAAPAPPPTVVATRKFEPPAAKRRTAEVPDVLLQPDTMVVPSVDRLAVPSVVILNKVLAAQRQFIRPPPRQRVQTLPEQPVLDAPMPLVGDAAVAAAKTTPLDRIPVLPVPSGVPSTVSGDSGKQVPATVATVSGSGTDGVALISLPSRPIPYTQSFKVPGVSIAGTPSGTAGGTSPTGSSDQRNTVAGTAASDEGTGPVKAGAGIARAGGSGSFANSTAGGTGGSGTDSGTTGGSGPGQGEAGTPGVSPESPIPGSVTGSPELVRMVRPADGKQDFVVTQVASSIPGSADLLTGRPVYSVYIPVGVGRDWILQYCVPSQRPEPAQARTRNTVVLELKPANPVAAPYAFLIFRPGLRFKPGVRYAFVHGFINEKGRFEGLKEAGANALEEVDSVIRALGNWEFRPASRDGAAISVEVLICIPRGSA
jgi:hypothetical protein